MTFCFCRLEKYGHKELFTMSVNLIFFTEHGVVQFSNKRHL